MHRVQQVTELVELADGRDGVEDRRDRGRVLSHEEARAVPLNRGSLGREGAEPHADAPLLELVKGVYVGTARSFGSGKHPAFGNKVIKFSEPSECGKGRREVIPLGTFITTCKNGGMGLYFRHGTCHHIRLKRERNRAVQQESQE